MKHSPAWPRILLPAVLACLLLAACSPTEPAPEDPRGSAATPLGLPATGDPASPAVPLPTASPFQPPADPVQPPAGQETGFYGLVVPDGWFFIPFQDETVQAVLFTPIAPADLQAFEDPDLAVPAGFVIGALARSPLPEGADPAALRANLGQTAAGLTDGDLESLLLGAGRIGLLDTAALEQAVLLEAFVDELGGVPALALRGELHFSAGRPPILETRIHLAWTDDGFFTFYALASQAAWEAHAALFDQARASVVLP